VGREVFIGATVVVVLPTAAESGDVTLVVPFGSVYVTFSCREYPASAVWTV
jgi:hypothetical protein